MLLMKLSKLSPPLLPVQSYSPTRRVSNRLADARGLLTNDKAFTVVAGQRLLRVDAVTMSVSVIRVNRSAPTASSSVGRYGRP